MAQQSRLVVIVDGLDSCEQDKVLLVLDAIQALFSDNGYPFVVILAIDPHIISKVSNFKNKKCKKVGQIVISISRCYLE